MSFFKQATKALFKSIIGLLGLITTLAVVGGLGLGALYIYFSAQLPNVDRLKTVRLQVPLRVFSRDGKLMAEYGEKRRIPVTLQEVPPTLIHAFLATEDSRFYSHPGVDLVGLARAAVTLALTGKKEQGGSTITMQVARNFFLTPEKTYTRKIKEILLAIKINHELSKDKILALYLNKIYLGNRAYGVAAAAQVYYGKTLKALTLPQMAMIAGLPKAPSSHNPLANPTAAMKRRNHVLYRMYTLKYIDEATYTAAINTPLTSAYHKPNIALHAPYVAELVRKTLMQRYGKEAYTQGFDVYTTINSKLQIAAEKALQKALLAYDKRHGYRGPTLHIDISNNNAKTAALKQLTTLPSMASLQPALVTSLQARQATAQTATETLTIPWQGLQWARKPLRHSRYLGRKPRNTHDILHVGDVIYVMRLPNGHYRLAQLPTVEGAIIAIDPFDGGVKALVGGFSYATSKFDRATQAQRQPGSSFKPFIYSAALAKGFTLASLINDAPVVYNDPSEENFWRPENDTKRFYGPTRLRVGLMKSRNLVSIRLLEAIGIDYALDFIQRFGFDANHLPHTPSLALGSGDVTPLEMAAGYAVFANGGYQVKPYFIKKILDSHKQPLFEATPKTACPYPLGDTRCEQAAEKAQLAPQVLSPQVAYLMYSAMQSVVNHGTGRGAKALERTDIAGKTGTTNQQFDAWFVGFNHTLATVAWVGFDKPRSLYEYGAQAALPLWLDFMKTALKGVPESPLTRPPGLVSVRINPETGLAANPSDKNSLFETFREAYAPQENITPADSDSENALNPEQIF